MEAATQTSTLSSSLITIISIVIISIIFLAIYIIPTIVANIRKHSQKTQILILNIFLGWSFIGWVIALIWAFKNENINNNNIDSQQ